MPVHTRRCGAIRFISILAILAALVASPRLAAGYRDVRQAGQALAAGNHAEAATQYTSAARRLPWLSGLWQAAGQSALAAGEYHDAVAMLEQAADRQSLTPEGWLSLAEACRLSGDFPAALEASARALERGADPASSYRQQAQIHLQMKEYASALESARLWSGAAPQEAQAHYALGLLLAAMRPEDALPDLMQAASLDPGLDAEIQSLRASLNLALLEQDPAYRLVQAGRGLAVIGEWDLASLAFHRATRAAPGYAEAWAWLGEASQQQGLDGLHYLEQAIELDPSSAMSLVMYGLYWQRQGATGAALDAFRQAVRLEPGNPAWLALAGDATARSGDVIAALGYYQEAAALAPTDPAYWRALAVFCLQYNADLPGVGLPAALEYAALVPSDWQAWDILGQAQQAMGYQASAESFYLKALELGDGRAAAAHFHLGSLYLSQGQRALAYDQWVKARNLDPQGLVGIQAATYLERYFP
ncbi:MAG: tetratricopeptide repeat protein [Chloroflexi bacterium]|nr:tetratricopeptide repeat protein [Chloroflexota bacterium]